MSRCPICRSKNLKTVQDAILCMSCENVVSNLSKDSTIKMLASTVDKEKQRNEHNTNMQKLQEEQTKKPYLRFQIRLL